MKPFDLKPNELKKREVIYIDIANDPDPTNVIVIIDWLLYLLLKYDLFNRNIKKKKIQLNLYLRKQAVVN